MLFLLFATLSYLSPLALGPWDIPIRTSLLKMSSGNLKFRTESNARLRRYKVSNKEEEENMYSFIADVVLRFECFLGRSTFALLVLCRSKVSFDHAKLVLNQYA